MTALRIYAFLSITAFLLAVIGLPFELRVGPFIGMRLVSLTTINLFVCYFLLKLQLKLSQKS